MSDISLVRIQDSNGFGYALTLVSGLVGALVFLTLELPLPWMLGALFGAFVAANVRWLPLKRPMLLSSSVRMVLGMAVGSAFTPAIVDLLGLYLLSIAAMIPYLIAVIAIGYVYFTRIARMDRRSGFFCALPGGMLEMTLICEAYGADIRRVGLIQIARVLLIVYTVPFAIHHLSDVDLSGSVAIGQPLSAMDPADGLILLSTALFGWLVMHRTGLPGAAIVGPMLSCGVIYATGFVSTRVPDVLINGAQWVLGAGVGAAFSGVAPRELGHALIVASGYFVLLMTLAMASAFLISQVTGVPLIATVLAYVPGGQAEMNVIALIVGIAVPYIALHHLVRMAVVMTIAPPLSRWILGDPPSGSGGDDLSNSGSRKANER